MKSPALLVLVCVFFGCASQPTRVETEHVAAGLTYPYVASDTRKAQIMRGLEELRIGMQVEETVAIVGSPDLIRPLHEPRMLNAKQIGTTRWYYLSIDAPKPPNNEQLVRVSVNNDGRLTAVDHWGFEHGINNGG